jgi:hypothetical protein
LRADCEALSGAIRLLAWSDLRFYAPTFELPSRASALAFTRLDVAEERVAEERRDRLYIIEKRGGIASSLSEVTASAWRRG